ncbi:MAG: thioesterase family protein [Candidatus Sumerlaeia bacterium]|nr:thioesterase family protein [Candidatus Sumerlaeia bacterium]
MTPSFPVPELLSREQRVPGRVAVGDRAAVRLAPGLLDFLMTPPGGDVPPPGRGTHPMSGLPLGLAVEAAIQAVDGHANGIDVLRACTCEFLAPVQRSAALVARARVVRLGRRSVTLHTELFHEHNPDAIFRAECTLVRAPRGSAEEIAPFMAPD